MIAESIYKPAKKRINIWVKSMFTLQFIERENSLVHLKVQIYMKTIQDDSENLLSNNKNKSEKLCISKSKHVHVVK
jgi:hypothetical protein